MINKDFLLANHTALVEELRGEGFARGRAEGLAAGAEAERARIQAVEAAAMPGCEALVKELKFDGRTSGDAAAAQIIAHYKAQNAGALQKLQADAAALPKVPAAPSQIGDAAAASAAAEEAKLPTAERCKKRWERNAAGCRDEFPSLEAYTAFEKADEDGRVKVLGGEKKAA